jgi:hypothetical protein
MQLLRMIQSCSPEEDILGERQWEQGGGTAEDCGERLTVYSGGAKLFRMVLELTERGLSPPHAAVPSGRAVRRWPA